MAEEEAAESKGSHGGHTNVFVTGLPSSAREQDIRELFETYGDIASIRLYAHIGNAFVKFRNVADAEAAIEAQNGTDFEGNEITVKFANKDFSATTERSNRKPKTELKWRVKGSVEEESDKDEEDEDHSNLFVNKLPRDIKDTVLRELFESVGSIESLRLFRRGTSQAYGFVKMETRELAEQAISDLNGHALGDECIEVKFAENDKGHQKEDDGSGAAIVPLNAKGGKGKDSGVQLTKSKGKGSKSSEAKEDSYDHWGYSNSGKAGGKSGKGGSQGSKGWDKGLSSWSQVAAKGSTWDKGGKGASSSWDKGGSWSQGPTSWDSSWDEGQYSYGSTWDYSSWDEGYKGASKGWGKGFADSSWGQQPSKSSGKGSISKGDQWPWEQDGHSTGKGGKMELFDQHRDSWEQQQHERRDPRDQAKAHGKGDKGPRMGPDQMKGKGKDQGKGKGKSRSSDVEEDVRPRATSSQILEAFHSLEGNWEGHNPQGKAQWHELKVMIDEDNKEDSQMVVHTWTDGSPNPSVKYIFYSDGDILFGNGQIFLDMVSTKMALWKDWYRPEMQWKWTRPGVTVRP